jgi:signal transduction histidine kinase
MSVEAALRERMRLAALGADVGVALTRGETLPDMLRHCAEAMVRHLDAAFARIWTLNMVENVLELRASAGLYTHLDGPHSRIPVGQLKIGLIALERQPHLTNAVIGDPRINDQAWARREGMVAFAGYPLTVGERLVGVMAMFARHPFTHVTLEALAAVANTMALGIERKHAEAAQQQFAEQLRQAQKMEAISTLTGGIAHDFNNILAAILVYTELALKAVPPDNPTRRYMQGVLAAAHRAKDLVQQLLAFSHTSDQYRQPVQLQHIMQDALRLICASLPSTIAIRQHVDPTSSTVLANPTQLHQVLLNLCSNAAYAMRATGGILEVGLEAVEVTADFAVAHPPLQPGPALRLTVLDTGHGMTPEILERIFEPFFTTKGVGEGTGLGLAVVHDIVADHAGTITVTSAPGQGTTFAIYLPSENAA